MHRVILPPGLSTTIQYAKNGRPRVLAQPWLVWIERLLLLLGAIFASVYLSWLALTQMNFLYPMWHDLIDIDQTIGTYAPQNRYKLGFEQTTKPERSRLFAAVVDAIHNHGKGLEGLSYHDPAGRPLGRLLRKPEIIHLRDVARLIDVMRPVGIGALITTVVLLVVIRRRRLVMPPISLLLLYLLLPLGAIAIGLLFIGPVKIFYWLHTLVFPPGHQWFFYYQDSLMSTMMKAPDLFGYIGLSWAALSLLLLIAFLTVVKRVLRSA
jgi:hypothetical protein